MPAQAGANGNPLPDQVEDKPFQPIMDFHCNFTSGFPLPDLPARAAQWQAGQVEDKLRGNDTRGGNDRKGAFPKVSMYTALPGQTIY